MLKIIFNNNDNVIFIVFMCSVYLYWFYWVWLGDVYKIFGKSEVLKLVFILGLFFLF